MKKASFILLTTILFSCSSKADKSRIENSESSEIATNADDRTTEKDSSDTTLAIPADGEYRFDVAFAEWEGKSMGEKVTVVIQGDSVKVIYAGDGKLTAKKGEVLDEGIILKHKSGDWIIGRNREDVNLEEIGGCTGGPSMIDFKNKKYWMC
ncbi:hypothetical protein [Pontibacter pamirensis]|uniref:hypothetical protein n=1 Tax=Pontibacter pamirensis TaxID=2562824 RepID=UPI00138964E9|nr:hypothetical protein [Pontibacter pamirensis]